MMSFGRKSLIFKGRAGGLCRAFNCGMTPAELRARTKRFAVEIIKLCRSLPTTVDGRVVGGQLIRAGTSVAANYRAACRGRSRAEFIAKLGIVLEEADESSLWLELMAESDLVSKSRIEKLLKEADELTGIFTAGVKTARGQ